MEGDGRRAAHVKWDGKTIALGTFPIVEAVEKCERAKALTKRWRASMIPKPGVEWVKKALERLNIRVVNDRPGRRRKDEIEHKEQPTAIAGANAAGPINDTTINDRMYPQISSRNIRRPDLGEGSIPYNSRARDAFSGMVMDSGPNEVPLNGFDSYPGSGGMANKISSIEENATSLGDLPNSFQSRMGQARLGGPPSNFDRNVPGDPFQDVGGTPGMESASASRQHYAILKEHHDNLLKELQQTTYMMRMYQTNYEEMEEQASNMVSSNMMGNRIFASDTRDGPMIGQSLGNRRQQQPFRPSQALGNSMQYPYDLSPRRNSLINQGQGPSSLSQSAAVAAASSIGGGFQNDNPNATVALQEMHHEMQRLRRRADNLHDRQQDREYSSNEFQFGQRNVRPYSGSSDQDNQDESRRIRNDSQGGGEGGGNRAQI
eukprot:scaffold1338_cov272-Chaetoceros_neogracile.AAC.3